MTWRIAMNSRVLSISALLAGTLCIPGETVAQNTSSPEISLRDLIREALERNPEVQMGRRMVDSKQARIPQAGALPDPTLIYGVMNEGRPVPFETLGDNGFSEAYVGFTQEIPYAGKRGLREKVASEEASAEAWKYEGIRRRVAARVAEAYYALYATDVALDIVDRSLGLLDQLTKIARARLSVGQTSQQDVLDAEVELSRLEERKSLLRQRRATTVAAIAQLLFRTAPEPLGHPAPVTETPLVGELADLLARAEEESPLVREARARLTQAERRVDLARRERLPDFGVNVVYHNRGELDPYYSFGGTLTLPIYAGRKQKKAIEEAGADLGAARSTEDAARAAVRFEVTESYLMASTADRLVRLYDEGILKQARLSLDSAIAQYQVGKVDFLTLISSWRRLLDYDLAYHEQLAEHEKALARIAVHVSPLPGQGT
jgi:outer membrane protein TolC